MITEHEADLASAGLEVMIHAAERFTEVLLQYYEQRIKERQDYLELKKKVGKQAANAYIKKLNREMLMSDEKMRLGEWCEAARKLLQKTERCTTVGMEAKIDKTVSACEMFDALMMDANMMCRLFLYYGNIPPEEQLKMESTLKLMGTRTAVPMEFINQNFMPMI